MSDQEMARKTGLIGTGSAKQVPPLERIYDKVVAHSVRLNDMVSALTNTMDQMVGVIPSDVPEQEKDVTAATSIAKINDMLSGQGGLLTQLEEQVQRVAELG